MQKLQMVAMRAEKKRNNFEIQRGLQGACYLNAEKKTDDTQLHIESIPDESTKGFNVVEICEQMVDAARELEDNRTEYALVTNYLTDIERMENMSETDKKTMNDAAANILTLEKTRSDFLKTKNRISDSQYAQDAAAGG